MVWRLDKGWSLPRDAERPGYDTDYRRLWLQTATHGGDGTGFNVTFGLTSMIVEVDSGDETPNANDGWWRCGLLSSLDSTKELSDFMSQAKIIGHSIEAFTDQIEVTVGVCYGGPLDSITNQYVRGGGMFWDGINDRWQPSTVHRSTAGVWNMNRTAIATDPEDSGCLVNYHQYWGSNISQYITSQLIGVDGRFTDGNARSRIIESTSVADLGTDIYWFLSVQRMDGGSGTIEVAPYLAWKRLELGVE